MSLNIVEQILSRGDGSQIRIVARKMYGLGLHPSIDLQVFRRIDKHSEWVMLSNRPNYPNCKTLPRDFYLKYGRSEVSTYVTPGELLKIQTLFLEDQNVFIKIERSPDSTTVG